MDASQIYSAVPTINNLSTIVAVAFVVPTYFVAVRPLTYRLSLSAGIIGGCLTFLTVTIGTLTYPTSQNASVPFIFLCFSPLTFVLLVLLAGIKRINRARLWSTVVLICGIANWAGISLLVLAFTP
ncbi:hypothetical protein [Bradyrhizobium sp. USDA 4353]